MAKKELIIVGAGIAGLATGCYARLNGYDTEIFEMHHQPGGVCTSWTRKDFVFDYCLHNLAGTAPGSDLRKVWDELGALNDTEIIDHPSFVRIEGPGGESLEWHNRLDRLVAHLKEIAPED
ncbi:MAG: NAD(P)/FAD-dependent oxidoreductase, partial [Candidatus Aminicenantes bacterium]|nr:NAD(P)/FAD-dependent oxidoreductase [Candidatus Aminicenantes bacterium]